MSEKLTCHVVKDLLPLYVDGLTSEETSRDIKAHLERCTDCRSQYQAMTGELAQEQQKQETKEIDYLKKVRRRNRGIVLGVACIALLVIGFGVMRVFMIGKTDKSVDNALQRIKTKLKKALNGMK